MNKKFYLPLLGLLLAGTACERIETEPKDWIRDELVWDEQDRNAVLAQYFLNDIYNYLPSGFGRISGDYLAGGDGDALPSRTARPVEYYTNGFISTINNPDPYWGNSYAGIRRVNIFLANIDHVPATPQSIVQWKAEARFIRVMLYFELVKRYGGVPLIGDRLFTLTDDLAVPRNSFEECVEYIVTECDQVKGDLRPEPISDAEWGRIPRGAAMALKSRLLLYAASPLYNGGNLNNSPLNGYLAYDASRWQRALMATQELMGLNYYGLQTGFGTVFTTKKNVEIILAKQAANSTNLESQSAPVGYGSPTASQGLTSPTQNLADAFPTLTGVAITEAGSGYNAQNPYANRDPRLALTVFANGTRWLNRSVETFNGGRDRPGGSAVQTRTGYYLRKFLADFASNTTYTNQSHNFPIFRYAETLLNYAEALNEVGRTEEALQQVIAIRRRAGITAGTGSRYGVAQGLSQAAARALIRNERRIELAFEEHRFWDVRRWKTADTELSGPLYGVQITRTGSTTAPTYTYTRQQVSTMIFQPKLYYLPLPYDETTKNPNLVQNPGW